MIQLEASCNFGSWHLLWLKKFQSWLHANELTVRYMEHVINAYFKNIIFFIRLTLNDINSILFMNNQIHFKKAYVKKFCKDLDILIGNLDNDRLVDLAMFWILIGDCCFCLILILLLCWMLTTLMLTDFCIRIMFSYSKNYQFVPLWPFGFDWIAHGLPKIKMYVKMKKIERITSICFWICTKT